MKKGLAQEGSQAPCTKWVWALLAAVLLFIWGNSLLPPSWSWRVSGVVQEAVEVGAANLRDPFACKKILEELPVLCEQLGVTKLSQLTGGAHV